MRVKGPGDRGLVSPVVVALLAVVVGAVNTIHELVTAPHLHGRRPIRYRVAPHP